MKPFAARTDDIGVRDLDQRLGVAGHGIRSSAEAASEGLHLHIFVLKRSIGEKEDGRVAHARMLLERCAFKTCLVIRQASRSCKVNEWVNAQNHLRLVICRIFDYTAPSDKQCSRFNRPPLDDIPAVGIRFLFKRKDIRCR